MTVLCDDFKVLLTYEFVNTYNSFNDVSELTALKCDVIYSVDELAEYYGINKITDKNIIYAYSKTMQDGVWYIYLNRDDLEQHEEFVDALNSLFKLYYLMDIRIDVFKNLRTNVYTCRCDEKTLHKIVSLIPCE